jgi:hypothetical protein
MVWHTEKAGGVEVWHGQGRRGAVQPGTARQAWSGRRKNRGEARAQGGFQPRVKEIKRKGFSYFWFQILNEFYSNSNDFLTDSKTRALNNTKIMHGSMNATKK